MNAYSYVLYIGEGYVKWNSNLSICIYIRMCITIGKESFEFFCYKKSKTKKKFFLLTYQFRIDRQFAVCIIIVLHLLIGHELQSTMRHAKYAGNKAL